MKPIQKKPDMQKVTVMLPRELVERAKRASGLGLTPAIRKGLESVAAWRLMKTFAGFGQG